MADKNLKISVKSDLREGRKLAEFITDLQKRVDKFAKTLGNINIGGMGPGGQPKPGHEGLAKQIINDKRAMEAMGREVEQLQRKFQNLGTAAQQAGVKMGGARGNGAGGLLYGPNGQPLPPSTPTPSAPTPPGASGGPAGPGGGGPGGPGGGGPWWQRPVGGGKGPFGQVVGQLTGPGAWFAVVNALKNTVLGAPQRDIDWATLSGKHQAYGGAADMADLGARALRGDIMPMVGAWRSLGNGGSWSEKGDLKSIVDNGQAAARNKAIGSVASLSGAARFVGDPTKTTSDLLMGLTDREEASQMLRQGVAQVKAGERSNLVQNEFFNYAMQQAPSRTAFSRRYGKDFSAGAALGQNVDPAQVAPVVAAVLDSLSQSGNTAKLTRVASEAMRMGLTNEAIQSMLRSGALGGGNLYEKILRSGMSRPMMSRAGTAAANFAMGGLVAGSSDLAAGAFTYGGARNDEFTQRRREAGLGLLDKVSTGAVDQYQATVNTALAVQQGGSVRTQGYMASMSFKDLLRIMRNGPTKQEEAAGITKAKATELLRAKVNSAGNRLFDEGANTTPGARAVLAAGNDVWGAIASGKNLPELSSGLNQAFGEDVNAEPAQALHGILSGGPNGPRARGHGGAYEGAQSFALGGARHMEGRQGELGEVLKVIGAASKSMDVFIKRMERAQTGMSDPDTAQRAIAGLGGVGDVMQKIASNSEKVTNVMQAVEKFVDNMVTKYQAVDLNKAVEDRIADQTYEAIHHKKRPQARLRK